MYACLSHLFLYNDICCSMYVINIVVEMMMMMMVVRLRPRMIESWLSYKIWDIRSVNRLYVDNLRPSGIGKTLPKFQKTSIWKLYKKKYLPCLLISLEVICSWKIENVTVVAMLLVHKVQSTDVEFVQRHLDILQ